MHAVPDLHRGRGRSRNVELATPERVLAAAALTTRGARDRTRSARASLRPEYPACAASKRAIVGSGSSDVEPSLRLLQGRVRCLGKALRGAYELVERRSHGCSY